MKYCILKWKGVESAVKYEKGADGREWKSAREGKEPSQDAYHVPDTQHQTRVYAFRGDIYISLKVCLLFFCSFVFSR